MKNWRQICSTVHSSLWSWLSLNGSRNFVFPVNTTVSQASFYRKSPTSRFQWSYDFVVNSVEPTLIIPHTTEDHKSKAKLFSFRQPGDSWRCQRHSHWCLSHASSLSLLCHNSHHSLPATHYVCGHTASLSRSTSTPDGKSSSGGRGGNLNNIVPLKFSSPKSLLTIMNFLDDAPSVVVICVT